MDTGVPGDGWFDKPFAYGILKQIYLRLSEGMHGLDGGMRDVFYGRT